MKAFINALFSAALLLVTIPTMQAMQPAKRAIKATKKQFSSWIHAMEEALTGETPANVVITQLNTPASKPLANDDETGFSRLPKDERNQIIFILSQIGISNNLLTTGQAINSLAQVNKELNALINDPKFYRNMSRNLATRFGVSNEEVAKALQTEQAKREWALQQHLRDLCFNEKNLHTNQIVVAFIQLMQKNVDLNFTYKNTDAPLMIAIYTNPDLASALIESGADLNVTDRDGNTPLMAAKLMENDELVKAIEKKLSETK